jgi:tRNA (adenine57-N1/adenine58-N1)-methyltransferase
VRWHRPRTDHSPDERVETLGAPIVETPMESLMRFWHIKDMSVRPEHRMVAHTGFITVARRLAAK